MEGQEVKAGGSRWFSRRGLLYGLIGTGALGAIFAGPILAAARNTDIGGLSGHRMCGSRFFAHRGGPEMQEHVKIAVKYALKDVGASDDQAERVNAILTAAMADVKALKDQHQKNRDAFRSQLGGTKIDREALEELRKSELALADDASKRLVQVLADVSDVLTPEQRQALMARHHRHGR